MKIAIVGYGVMGQHHARVLRELGHTIVTVDPARDVADHTDLDEVDAEHAVIATPIDQLQRTAQRCLERGMNVLLVEKPGAHDLRHATLLAAQHPNAAVGYVERHNPALVAMNEHLYRIGTVIDVHAERTGPHGRQPADPAIDLATHDIDAIRYLDIYARPMAYMNDGAQVNVLFDSGTLSASHAHPTKRRQLRVLGTEGELVCDYQAQSLTFNHPGGSEDLSPPKAEPLRRMWQAILDGKPHATTHDALSTLRTALTLLCHTQEPASTATRSSRTAKAQDARRASSPGQLKPMPRITKPLPTTEPRSGAH